MFIADVEVGTRFPWIFLWSTCCGCVDAVPINYTTLLRLWTAPPSPPLLTTTAWLVLLEVIPNMLATFLSNWCELAKESCNCRQTLERGWIINALLDDDDDDDEDEDEDEVVDEVPDDEDEEDEEEEEEDEDDCVLVLEFFSCSSLAEPFALRYLRWWWWWRWLGCYTC